MCFSQEWRTARTQKRDRACIRLMMLSQSTSWASGVGQEANQKAVRDITPLMPHLRIMDHSIGSTVKNIKACLHGDCVEPLVRVLVQYIWAPFACDRDGQLNLQPRLPRRMPGADSLMYGRPGPRFDAGNGSARRGPGSDALRHRQPLPLPAVSYSGPSRKLWSLTSMGPWAVIRGLPSTEDQHPRRLFLA